MGITGKRAGGGALRRDFPLHFARAVCTLLGLMTTSTRYRPLVAILPNHASSTVSGRHRARFLHAMTTADIAKAAPGAAGFALMATAKGRHVGQVRYEVAADRIELVGRKGSLASVLEALHKHRVADDVRWTEPSPAGVLAVYGPDAEALTHGVIGARPGEGADFCDATWSDMPVRLTRVAEVDSEIGRPAVHLRLSPALLPSLRVRLLSAGAEPLDEADWERLRIESGWPLDGIDLSGEDVALASERLAATVSWTKGCFLGQEVYVMARDRGELPKRLRAVVVPGGGLPAAHAELFPVAVESPKAQGFVGSAAPVAAGGYLALAMLKRKVAEPGTELALADGRRVKVVALPVSAMSARRVW
jgi:tRNA-modifying protein YgfZ